MLKRIRDLLSIFKDVNKVIICLFALVTFCTFLSIPIFTSTNHYKIVWILTIIYCLFIFGICLFKYGFFINTFLFFVIIYIFSIVCCSLINYQGVFVYTSLLLSILLVVIFQAVSIDDCFKKTYLFSLFASIVLFAFVFLFHYRKSIFSGNVYRLGQDFGDLNEIAIYFALGLIISFKNILKKDVKVLYRVVFAFLFLVFVICGFLTGSKGFLLSSFISSVIIIFIFFGIKKWYFSIIAVALMIIAVLLILQINIFSTIRKRMIEAIVSLFSKNAETLDFSTLERSEMIIDGIVLFLRSPVFGFGNYGFYLYSASEGYAWSHNQFTEILVQYGVVGGIGFFVPMLLVVKNYFLGKKNSLAEDGFVLMLFVFSWFFSIAFDTLKIYPFIMAFIYSSSATTNNKSFCNRFLVSRLFTKKPKGENN